jgi:ribonuclease HI
MTTINNTPVVHVYTDGACSPNPNGKGGWGVFYKFGEVEKSVSGGKPKSTNNEMELTAILKAIEGITTNSFPIVIYSDSQYAINCCSVWSKNWVNNGWKTANGKPVKNAELISTILSTIEDKKLHVTWKWVKAHAGDRYNEIVDNLAVEGRKNLR